MKFDFSTKTLCISVRELVEPAQSRHRNFTRDSWWVSLGVGTETHSRMIALRQAAILDYRSEICVEREMELSGWKVRIQGRIDGLYPEADSFVLEEFKTVQTFPSRPHLRHQMQLLVYCYLFGNGLETQLKPRLVYCSLETEGERSFDVSYTPAKVLEFITSSFALYLDEAKAHDLRRQEKIWASLSLQFPHRQPRPGQDLLVKKMDDALETGGSLLAQAATGIGKTAAALFSSLKWALSTNKRVLFLTSKTLQQEIAVKTVTKLNTAGAFRSIQIASKEKMCANDRIICHEDACPYARDYQQKMERSHLTDRLFKKSSHLSPAEIFKTAEKEKVCPFEVQMELAAKADLLIADYNYLFERSAAFSFLDEDAQDCVAVIDEAHNLPDRIREIYSPVLVTSQIHAATAFLQNHPKAGKHAAELLQKMEEVLREQNCPRPAFINPPTKLEELWPDWERAFIRYFSWKSEEKLLLEKDPVMDFHFSLLHWMRVLRHWDSGFICVSEKVGPDQKLSIRCLDPARVAGPVLNRLAANLLVSATLSPFTATAKTLGLPDADRIDVPSPFSQQNRKILIYPNLSTTYQSRPRCYDQVAELLKSLAGSVTGRVLVLFPSYEFLHQTFSRVEWGAGVLMQRPGGKKGEDLKLFESFRNLQNGLLFAVLGGMFSEGLDFPDNLLSGVVVISPGLPQVTWQREALRKYYEEQCGDGFLYAYLQPGMTKVIQAAGRLIRNESDRGFILLVCERFTKSPYAELLPPDWMLPGEETVFTSDPVAEIREFFKSFPPLPLPSPP